MRSLHRSVLLGQVVLIVALALLASGVALAQEVPFNLYELITTKPNSILIPFGVNPTGDIPAEGSVDGGKTFTPLLYSALRVVQGGTSFSDPIVLPTTTGSGGATYVTASRKVFGWDGTGAAAWTPTPDGTSWVEIPLPIAGADSSRVVGANGSGIVLGTSTKGNQVFGWSANFGPTPDGSFVWRGFQLLLANGQAPVVPSGINENNAVGTIYDPAGGIYPGETTIVNGVLQAFHKDPLPPGGMWGAFTALDQVGYKAGWFLPTGGSSQPWVLRADGTSLLPTLPPGVVAALVTGVSRLGMVSEGIKSDNTQQAFFAPGTPASTASAPTTLVSWDQFLKMSKAEITNSLITGISDLGLTFFGDDRQGLEHAFLAIPRFLLNSGSQLTADKSSVPGGEKIEFTEKFPTDPAKRPYEAFVYLAQDREINLFDATDLKKVVFFDPNDLPDGWEIFDTGSGLHGRLSADAKEIRFDVHTLLKNLLSRNWTLRAWVVIQDSSGNLVSTDIKEFTVLR